LPWHSQSKARVYAGDNQQIHTYLSKMSSTDLFASKRLAGYQQNINKEDSFALILHFVILITHIQETVSNQDLLNF
jgi:hypothetical protein